MNTGNIVLPGASFPGVCDTSMINIWPVDFVLNNLGLIHSLLWVCVFWGQCCVVLQIGFYFILFYLLYFLGQIVHHHRLNRKVEVRPKGSSVAPDPAVYITLKQRTAVAAWRFH